MSAWHLLTDAPVLRGLQGDKKVSPLVRQLLWKHHLIILLANRLAPRSPHLARLDLSTMTLAAELRRCHGLLVNDSLLAATAAREGIVDFASADADFERVEELRLFRPGDL